MHDDDCFLWFASFKPNLLNNKCNNMYYTLAEFITGTLNSLFYMLLDPEESTGNTYQLAIMHLLMLFLWHIVVRFPFLAPVAVSQTFPMEVLLFAWSFPIKYKMDLFFSYWSKQWIRVITQRSCCLYAKTQENFYYLPF